MSTTRLSLYKGALLACGERTIASLSEDREPRRLLDLAWDAGAVDFCLNQGQWSFAKRTRQMAPDTGIDPGFGYANAYEIPSDFVRTIGIWSDEYCTAPLLTYSTEGGYWFTDTEPIFVSYVSNDTSYGGDYSNWPMDFVEAVQLYLASKIIRKLTQSEDREKEMESKAKQAFKAASSSDAMEGPTKFAPQSSWVRSRINVNSRRDRGSRGKLIG